METSNGEGAINPQERAKHYQLQVENLLNDYGKDFTHFTQGYEQLVQIGDEKMKTYQTTGYNILRQEEDMPLASEKKLIFYGNYVARTEHFSLLLAAMEQDGVIRPDQIRFGVRAAKVLDDPEWGDNSDVAQAGVIQRINEQGEQENHHTLQSIETVVLFSPSNDENAKQIVDFLNERAKDGMPEAIKDSNVAPDIRATWALRDILSENKFPTVQANIHQIGQGQVIVLRKETGFTQPWVTTPIEANKELVSYIVGEGILP